MGKFEELVRGLALAAGISSGAAGCDGAGPTGTAAATPPTPPVTPDPGYGDPSVEANLARLQALQVFDVGALILDLPDQATACYGLPCPADVTQSMLRAARARQAPRLARLTALAESAAASTEIAPAAPADVAGDLQALRDLRVVEIGDLIAAVPVAQPSCYNQPCPEDLARADADTQRRAGVVRVLGGEAAQVDDGGL
jgi:hypothetical protein